MSPDIQIDLEARLYMGSPRLGGDDFRLYLGPLDYRYIKQYEGLYGMVDYGWNAFEWITRPLARFIFIPTFALLSSLIPSYGLVIIVFCLLIKLVLFPITRVSYKSMAGMRELAPQMKEIKEKYKDNPQKQQQATMKLYKETGMNPLSSCLPMLLQYPIIIALWQFLQQSIDIRQQSFLWAPDLSAPDAILDLPFSIPFYGDYVAGFTVLMGVSLVIQMRVQSTPTSGMQQKMMMYGMPLVIFVVFNRLPSGLSLYYLFYNVFTAAQQQLINIGLKKKKAQEPTRKGVIPKRPTEEKGIRQGQFAPQVTRAAMTASDTIAAIATARGKAALAIVRVSGAQAIEVAARCFQGADLSKVYSHTLHVGLWHAPGGDALDQVVCAVFRAPRSFTGEDMVEVSCHGGDYVVTLVLQSLLAAGSRLAAPGEFTQRAFLNGKLDLVQAEAVADLIHASSSRAHRASVDSLRGRYSKTIDELRMALLDVCALAELEIDFSDEDVEFADRRALRSLLHNTQRLLTQALASYALGELVREGVRVVIAGRPNAGKSTLLNALLGEDRAIVSDTPGTTRDTVAADKEIGGLLFRFIDTAGLHDAVDLIEAEGVRRSREAIVKADLVLYVYDLSVGLAESERIPFWRRSTMQTCWSWVTRRTWRVEPRVLPYLR